MRKPLEVVREDVRELDLCGKTLHNPRAFESRLHTPNVKDVLFNGLLVEQCFIHTMAASNVKARNVIIGPHTAINWSLLTNVKVKFAHAFLNSVVAHSLITESGFCSGTYKSTTFNGNVFYNTIFIGCKFIATVFRDCYFSGCMFYNCSFSHNDYNGPFLNCNFEPDTVYGRFQDQAETWPSLADKKVETNYFLYNGGNIKMTNCTGIKNTSLDLRRGNNIWEAKFGDFVKPTKRGGNKAIQFAFDNWWSTNGQAIPLPAASTPVSKPPPPQKHKLRAYRFVTTGI